MHAALGHTQILQNLKFQPVTAAFEFVKLQKEENETTKRMDFRA